MQETLMQSETISGLPLPILLLLIIGALMVIAGITGHVWEGIDDRPLPKGWKRIFIVIGLLLITSGIIGIL